MSFILGVAVGLIVGWNFLPQPEIIKTNVEKLLAKVKS